MEARVLQAGNITKNDFIEYSNELKGLRFRLHYRVPRAVN